MMHCQLKLKLKLKLFLLCAAVIWLHLAGCTPTAEPPVTDIPSPSPSDYVYRIGPEDQLTVSVWKNEEISRTVVVRPDGMISLPLLNDVKAAGLTPEELRQTLVEKLADYINNVELSVIINEIHSLKFSVLGEVTSPARYDYRSRLTVLEAIALAGGLRPFAARKRIVILRSSEGDEAVQHIPFDYDRAAASNGAVGNPALLPGDIVMVPSSNF